MSNGFKGTSYYKRRKKKNMQIICEWEMTSNFQTTEKKIHIVYFE